MNQEDQELISLNKFISSSGFCSRREADKYIEEGRVTINNAVANIGMRVSINDVVAVDGEKLKPKKKQPTIYMAFNKPVGVTSTTDPTDKSNIISYINYHKRIFPIGRLDKDSDGLIFLTNDGDIVNKILRAGNNHDKEYIVTVNKAITPDFIKQMSNGIPILGKMTKKCTIRKEGNKKFRIILTEGMNRQIRRMCRHLDYKVMSLTRVRIMNVSLGKLHVGKWRLLTAAEVDTLNKLVASSSKTEEASSKTKNSHPSKSTSNKSKISTKRSNDKKSGASPKNNSYKDWRKKR
ncbi:MAG: 23S rRNA pseudouridine(2604) synthase RluF [Flavipsychrobacter sp.]